MQRNYPQMFSPADDQDKDVFKLENVGPTKYKNKRMFVCLGYFCSGLKYLPNDNFHNIKSVIMTIFNRSSFHLPFIKVS